MWQSYPTGTQKARNIRPGEIVVVEVAYTYDGWFPSISCSVKVFKVENGGEWMELVGHKIKPPPDL